MSSLSKRASSQLKITVDIDDLKHFKKEHGTVDAFLKSHRLSGLSTNTKKVRDACEISISAQSNSDVYRAASLFQRYLSEWWDIIKSGDINQAKQQIKQDKKVIHRVTSHGATCLMVACGHRGYSLGHTDPDLVAPNGRMLDFLLDQGAKAHLPDNKGHTCADLVTDRPALAAMLTHGAAASSSGTDSSATPKKRKSIKKSTLKSSSKGSKTLTAKATSPKKSNSDLTSISSRGSSTKAKKKPSLSRGNSATHSDDLDVPRKMSAKKRKSEPNTLAVSDVHVRCTSGLAESDAQRMKGIDLVSLLTTDAGDLGLPALKSTTAMGTVIEGDSKMEEEGFLSPVPIKDKESLSDTPADSSSATKTAAASSSPVSEMTAEDISVQSERAADQISDIKIAVDSEVVSAPAKRSAKTPTVKGTVRKVIKKPRKTSSKKDLLSEMDDNSSDSTASLKLAAIRKSKSSSALLPRVSKSPARKVSKSKGSLEPSLSAASKRKKKSSLSVKRGQSARSLLSGGKGGRGSRGSGGSKSKSPAPPRIKATSIGTQSENPWQIPTQYEFEGLDPLSSSDPDEI